MILNDDTDNIMLLGRVTNIKTIHNEIHNNNDDNNNSNENDNKNTLQ